MTSISEEHDPEEATTRFFERMDAVVIAAAKAANAIKSLQHTGAIKKDESTVEVSNLPGGFRVFVPTDHDSSLAVGDDTNNSNSNPDIAPETRNHEDTCQYCKNAPCWLHVVDPEFSQDKSLLELMKELGEVMVDAGKTNKESRFELYHFSTRFCHGTLGKRNRRRVPACISYEIMSSFPAPSEEGYTGFKQES